MAKRIRSTDLFEKEDIFEGIRQSAKKTIDQLHSLDAEFKKIATSMKQSVGGAKFDSTKSVNEFVNATRQANKLMEDSIKIERMKAQADAQMQKAMQESEKVAQQRLRTEQQQIRTDRDRQKEQERLAKASERAAKLAADESNAYKQLEKNTRELKNESKRLGAELLQLEANGKKHTAEWRNLQSQYQKTTQAAQQGDAQLKKLDKTVGDNFRNVGNYREALGGLQNALGQLGVAFTAGSVIQGAFGIVKDFDQSMQNLASILGKSRGEIVKLEQDAKRLGATTRFTASEVGTLQTELSKLGFSEDEILNATESVLNLAGATGTDLGRAAEVAGATMRAFGIDANNMQRVNDVMAKSFNSSALDMEKFAESMKYVAPVAKSAGISLEQTSAYLSVLADNGIRGSQAGTSLRRIFTDMAMTGKDAKTALAELSQKGLTLEDAFDEVGRTAQTSLLILSENQDKVEKLSDTYNHAAGSAKAMADTQLNSIQGSLFLLTSAWEGYLLKINDASGAGNTFAKSIKWLADNLETILDTVVMVIKIWIRYQIIIKATMLSNKLMASSFITLSRNIGGMRGVLAGIGQAFQGLGRMIQQNIVGIALVVIAEIAMQMRAAGEGTRKFKEAQEELRGATDTVTVNIKREKAELKLMFDALLETNAGSRERSKLITDINNKYGTTLKNLSDEAAFVRQARTEYAKLEKQLEERGKSEKARIKFETTQRQLAEAEAAFDMADQALKAFRSSSMTDRVLSNLFEFFGATGEKELSDAYNAASDFKYQMGILAQTAEEEYMALQKEMLKNQVLTPIELDNTELKTYTGSVNSNTKATRDNTNEHQKQNTEFRELNDYISEQTKLLQELYVIEQKRAELKLAEQIEAEAEAVKKLALETGEYSLAKFRELADQKYGVEIKNLEQRRDATIAMNNANYEREKADRLKQLEEEKKDLLKNDKLTAGEKAEIEKNYQKKLEELKAQEVERVKDVATQNKVTTENTADEIYALEKESLELINDLTQEAEENANTFREGQKEKGEKDREDELKAIKDAEERKREIIKQTADLFTKLSEKRIEQMDKEIAAAERQYENYKSLAEQGNINAQQSLAEQQRIIDQANLRKERELKRQQRIKLAESVYSTYSQKVESGSANPLAETIRDTTLLQQFIASLPTFLEGTEDTGTNGRGIDGKGGFHAVLHPNERVIPKSLNEKIGALTNTQLAKVAQEYQNGKLMEGATQSASALELTLLVNEIKDLKQVIKDKPETNIELGEITQSVVEIVEKRVRGNSTTYNRFKVRK